MQEGTLIPHWVIIWLLILYVDIFICWPKSWRLFFSRCLVRGWYLVKRLFLADDQQFDGRLVEFPTVVEIVLNACSRSILDQRMVFFCCEIVVLNLELWLVFSHWFSFGQWVMLWTNGIMLWWCFEQMGWCFEQIGWCFEQLGWCFDYSAYHISIS